MPTPETVIIQSDDGQDVTYTIHPHGAAEGFDLAPKILALLSAPAQALAALSARGGVAAPALPAASGEAGDPAALASALADDAEGLLGGVDGPALGAAIRELGSTIVAQGGHRLCLTLLKYTTAAPEGGSPLKMDNVAAFNARYAANYGELFHALYHVIRVNWGPMIARMAKGGDPLGALGALARGKKTGR